MISVLFCFCVEKKTLTKINLSNKDYSILHFQMMVYHSARPRQEVKQRPWKNSSFWLALNGLLSLLSCIIQEGLPSQEWHYHSRLGLPNVWVKQKLSCIHGSRLMWWRQFLNCGSLSRWLGLCQAGKKLTSPLSKDLCFIIIVQFSTLNKTHYSMQTLES